MRADRIRHIEQIRIGNEWTNKRNLHFNIQDKPTDFKTFKGRLFTTFDYGIESSDGESILSDVSDFSDFSDDEE